MKSGHRSGLGKGLEALIPPGQKAVLQEIPVDRVSANPSQPRIRVDEESFEHLADSVRDMGVLQPILVRRKGQGFVLVAGERRWRAAQKAGLSLIPALIRETDDRGALVEALVENLIRQDLNPIEEASAFLRLEQEFGMTHAEIGQTMGRSRVAVTNSLRLLKLPTEVADLVSAGKLTAGHGRALLAVEDESLANHLAARTVAEEWTVRRLEEAVRLGGRIRQGSKPKKPKSPRPAVIVELERRLAEQLGTSVEIKYKERKKGSADGHLILRFSGLDQLETIYRRFFVEEQ